jgi:chromosome segregation ATPase
MTDRILEDAKKFSNQFAGFLQAAQKWGDIQSLDQACKEAEDRLAAKRKEEGDLDATMEARHQAMVGAVNAELAQRRADADAYEDVANQKAHHILEAANQEADKMFSDAKDRALKFTTDVNVEHGKTKAQNERLQALNAELEQENKRLQETHKALTASVEEMAQKQHEVNQHLSDLASKFAGVGIHSAGSVFPGMR